MFRYFSKLALNFLFHVSNYQVKMSDHDKNREKICLICLNLQVTLEHKATNLKKLKYRFIQRSKEDDIKKYFLPTYEFENKFWPAIICNRCNVALSEAKRGLKRRKIEKYEVESTSAYSLRHKNCACFFCTKVKGLKTQPSSFKKKKKPKLGQKSDSNLCKNCWSELHKGKSHKCNKTTLVKKAVAALTEAGAHLNVLSKLVKQQSTPTMELKNLRGKRTVIYLQKPKKIEPLTIDDVNEFRKDFVNSDKKTAKLFTKLRRKGMPVQPKAIPTAWQQSDDLQQFFAVSEELFEIGNEQNRQMLPRTVAYCSKIHEFLKYVQQKRSIEDGYDVLLKFGTDDGGGSLKVCVTVVYKDVLTDNKNGKLTSVKRIFVVAVANNVPETNANLRKIFSLIGISDVTEFGMDIWFTGDYKIQNKMVGIQDCACTFPCFTCTANKNALNCDRYTLRTFGSIREQNAKWLKNGGQKKDLPKFFSCISTPVFEDTPDDCPVNQVFVMGELHITMGVTNYLLTQCKKIDSENLEEWLESRSLSRQGLHGSFNGNDCKRIMENSHDLAKKLSAEAVHFAQILEAFNSLVDACFGTQLDESWSEKHEHFFWLLERHDIKFTPKLHSLKFHVPEFINEHQRPLGLYSEQASESIHHEWKKFIDNYAHSSIHSNQHYLLRAITKFNYLNI